MAHNKFFNDNLKENKEENNTTTYNTIPTKEYDDQIYIPQKDDHGENIDRSNPVVKIFLIALGIFCILGAAYYIIPYFTAK